MLRLLQLYLVNDNGFITLQTESMLPLGEMPLEGFGVSPVRIPQALCVPVFNFNGLGAEMIAFFVCLQGKGIPEMPWEFKRSCLTERERSIHRNRQHCRAVAGHIRLRILIGMVVQDHLIQSGLVNRNLIFDPIGILIDPYQRIVSSVKPLYTEAGTVRMPQKLAPHNHNGRVRLGDLRFLPAFQHV
ncbi:hypothetical protein D3C75_747980 [compost metagenome]